MTATSDGRTTAVMARNLRPHHIGKTFDGLGELFSITFDRDGVMLMTSAGVFDCEGECVLEWHTPRPTGKPKLRADGGLW